MNLLIHLIAILPIVYYLYPSIGLINSIFLFMGGWISDIDHYLYCIFKHRNFSFKKCYEFHMPFAKEKDVLHIFHIAEFYILTLIIGLFIEPFLYLFYGLLYHLIFDLIKLAYLKYYAKDPRADQGRAYSLIMWLRRHYTSK